MLDFAQISRSAVFDPQELASLCRRCSVRRLYLFGSAATGRFDPVRSDLDFLVIFEPMSHTNFANIYFSLLEGLEAMFERPIDLITESALANPYFRQRVEAERTVVFER